VEDLIQDIRHGVRLLGPALTAARVDPLRALRSE
jgi:hypothetical protein